MLVKNRGHQIKKTQSPSRSCLGNRGLFGKPQDKGTIDWMSLNANCRLRILIDRDLKSSERSDCRDYQSSSARRQDVLQGFRKQSG